MTYTIIAGILGVIFLLAGGIIGYYTPAKRDPSKESTITDKIGPLISKDFVVRPQKIYNDLYGDDLERKRTIMRTTGLIFFILGCLLSMSVFIFDFILIK